MTVQAAFLVTITRSWDSAHWRNALSWLYQKTVSPTGVSVDLGPNRRPSIRILDGSERLANKGSWIMVLQIEENKVLIRGRPNEPTDWPSNNPEHILDTRGMSAAEVRNAIQEFVSNSKFYEIVLYDDRRGWLRLAKVRGQRGKLLVASENLYTRFRYGRTPWKMGHH